VSRGVERPFEVFECGELSPLSIFLVGTESGDESPHSKGQEKKSGWADDRTILVEEGKRYGFRHARRRIVLVPIAEPEWNGFERTFDRVLG
jgi:hypothetical protein